MCDIYVTHFSYFLKFIDPLPINQEIPENHEIPENRLPSYSELVWTDPVGNFCEFPFTGGRGMNPDLSAMLATSPPIDYFSIFFIQGHNF